MMTAGLHGAMVVMKPILIVLGIVVVLRVVAFIVKGMRG